MIATRNIKKGGELINDYGSLSNGELLRRCMAPHVSLLSAFHETVSRGLVSLGPLMLSGVHGCL